MIKPTMTHAELIVHMVASVIAQHYGQISPEPHMELAGKIFTAISEHAEHVKNGRNPSVVIDNKG